MGSISSVGPAREALLEEKRETPAREYYHRKRKGNPKGAETGAEEAIPHLSILESPLGSVPLYISLHLESRKSEIKNERQPNSTRKQPFIYSIRSEKGRTADIPE